LQSFKNHCDFEGRGLTHLKTTPRISIFKPLLNSISKRKNLIFLILNLRALAVKAKRPSVVPAFFILQAAKKKNNNFFCFGRKP